MTIIENKRELSSKTGHRSVVILTLKLCRSPFHRLLPRPRGDLHREPIALPLVFDHQLVSADTCPLSLPGLVKYRG